MAPGGAGTLTSPSLSSSSSNPPAGDSLQVPPPPSLLPTLPPELVEDILCRLPMKSLLRFRCVCKSWNSLISDPKFARRHLRKFTRHYLIVKFKFNNALNPAEPVPTRRLEYPLNIDDCYDVVGSFHGLLCCCAFANHTFLIWNPSTRKFMETPVMENENIHIYKECYVIQELYGFGYDNLTETYKVVVIHLDVDCDKSQVMVHTLGCPSWRMLLMISSPVTEDRIQRDLWMNKFDWDHPINLQPTSPTTEKNVNVVWDAYEATKDADGVCVLTEWDEFKSLDYQRIYDNMRKPALLFDGRNVVDADKLREIGFIVYSIGKPLDAWLKDMPVVA